MDVNGREAEMSDNLMSPFCPGRTLSSCPSDQAGNLRQEIRGLMESGKSDQEIQQILVVRYGDDVRGFPRPEGAGLLIWIFPAAFLFLSVLVVVLILRRSVNSRSTAEKEI